MKVICVVDSLAQLNKKLDLIYNNFGSDVCFVVKGPYEKLFKTFGFTPNAVYNNNLTKIIHTLLLSSQIDDVLVVYTSLNLNQALINKFNQKIGLRDAVVSLMPKYNFIERMHNNAYNIYVKSMFKMRDSMSSPKFQFLPAACVVELLNTHFGNKLFEVNPKLNKNVTIEDSVTNKSAKIHPPKLKLILTSIIVALLITIALISSLKFAGMSVWLVVLFVCFYVLDIFASIVIYYKSLFDHRFLR